MTLFKKYKTHKIAKHLQISLEDAKRLREDADFLLPVYQFEKFSPLLPDLLLDPRAVKLARKAKRPLSQVRLPKTVKDLKFEILSPTETSSGESLTHVRVHYNGRNRVFLTEAKTLTPELILLDLFKIADRRKIGTIREEKTPKPTREEFLNLGTVEFNLIVAQWEREQKLKEERKKTLLRKDGEDDERRIHLYDENPSPEELNRRHALVTYQDLRYLFVTSEEPADIYNEMNYNLALPRSKVARRERREADEYGLFENLVKEEVRTIEEIYGEKPVITYDLFSYYRIFGDRSAPSLTVALRNILLEDHHHLFKNKSQIYKTSQPDIVSKLFSKIESSLEYKIITRQHREKTSRSTFIQNTNDPTYIIYYTKNCITPIGVAEIFPITDTVNFLYPVDDNDQHVLWNTPYIEVEYHPQHLRSSSKTRLFLDTNPKPKFVSHTPRNLLLLKDNKYLETGDTEDTIEKLLQNPKRISETTKYPYDTART